MLRAADPSGEGFIIDSDGEVPCYFESKPGYYDGAYSFIDDQGRIVFSTEEGKVDISSQGLTDAVWETDYEMGRAKKQAIIDGVPFVLNKEEWLAKVMGQFVFHDGVPEDFRKDIEGKARKEYESLLDYREKSDAKWLLETMEKCRNGTRFFEPIDYQQGRLAWRRTPDEHGHGGVCGGEIDALTQNPEFERVPHDDQYWEWRPRAN